MNPNVSLIITSIAAPNAVMKTVAGKCRENGVDFIVLGDAGSPKTFQLDGCRFYGLEEQKNLPFKLAKLLPEKHYARKNLGYLLAGRQELILELDDDNLPKENFWHNRIRAQEAYNVSEGGWINVYRYFSDAWIWPRGFPLEELNRSTANHFETATLPCPVQQGLADENPDVDAIYRMTQKLPIVFNQNKNISLGPRSWCPFNSQNTTWFKEAFLLMYLPSTCSFRMTDTWRSFIAQRILWTCGWNVLFHEATVIQQRNPHDLLKDFSEEITGFLYNARICRLLEDLDLESGTENISENLIRCYKLMTEEKFLDKKELVMVEAWIQDIA